MRCKKYLDHYRGCHIEFIHAERLTKSSREAPWRIDIKANGEPVSYVLQLDVKNIEYEYRILKAMEAIPVPTPKVSGLDLQGDALGLACFFSDFINGESLLGSMLAGEPWAEELYLDAVCSLQDVTEDRLGSIAQRLNRETAEDVLEEAYGFLRGQSLSLADTAYRELMEGIPGLPPVRFSNCDLWMDNFIVKDQKLAGVIDFANAAFSDPIYEFLLSFFVSPGLQGRGIEERYCRRNGYDPGMLDWYNGLEYFDSLRWVLITGESFLHHTAESLQTDLWHWLEEGG